MKVRRATESIKAVIATIKVVKNPVDTLFSHAKDYAFNKHIGEGGTEL